MYITIKTKLKVTDSLYVQQRYDYWLSTNSHAMHWTMFTQNVFHVVKNTYLWSSSISSKPLTYFLPFDQESALKTKTTKYQKWGKWCYKLFLLIYMYKYLCTYYTLYTGISHDIRKHLWDQKELRKRGGCLLEIKIVYHLPAVRVMSTSSQLVE